MFTRKNIFELTSRLRESVFEQSHVVSSLEKILAVQYEMVNCLSDFTDDEFAKARLQFRLMGATDVQTLWSLRGDLMLFLSSHSGESVARARLDDITAMFAGLVSEGQMPKRRIDIR